MTAKVSNDTFINVLEDHKKIIYKVCNAYCKNADDRQDLIQEVIIQLWRSFERYNDQFKLSTWIYRIALNVSISFYRKESKRLNRTDRLDNYIIDVADLNLEEENKNENLRLLQQFINELDELNRALMILYLDDNSYSEIAEILGISETNVATKINRVKQKLKQRFSNINT